MPFLGECLVHVDRGHFARVWIRADIGVLWVGNELQIIIGKNTTISNRGRHATIRSPNLPIKYMLIHFRNVDHKDQFFRALGYVTQKSSPSDPPGSSNSGRGQ
jgi:hypothetical protein